MPRPASAAQLRHVVQAAVLAPSVHNTQPWRFVQGEGSLQLFADLARQLPVIDPVARQLHLSCGAALQHALVAARGLGLDVTSRLVPDPDRPDLLAEIHLEEGATASPDEVAMATAILHRHTFRGAFAPTPVPAGLMPALQHEARRFGVNVYEVFRPSDLVVLEVALSHADEDEERDPQYRRELAAWVHDDPGRLDGLPVQALDSAAGSSLRQRDFTLSHPERTDGSAPRADHPRVVILATAGDDRAGWLKTGQALAAVLLRAADGGVQGQPLGQLTDGAVSRYGLRGSLNLIDVPQMVLRLGVAAGAAPTPRRAVEDVLSMGR